MAENEASLLENTFYDEKCPGCRLDRRKRLNRGIPVRDFLFVCIITVCTSLPISSLYPFLYFMIRDLHVAERTQDIGFYAGFVGSAFMLGRCLTSLFWGMAADRYGRKPIILLGAISVIILNGLFGLSTSYWMALTTRFFLGFCNGMLGPVKALASEVCHKEHEALGMSIVSTSLNLGLVIGPSIGGYLAQPADNYPNIFAKESLFGRFPYFLPCLTISVFASIVFVACLWLPETLHMHVEDKRQGSDQDPEFSAPDCSKNTVEEKTSKKNLLKNWPLMSSIIVYCIVAFHNTAYTEDVGEVLAVSGCSLILYQLLLYQPIKRRFGPVASIRVALLISIPLLATYSFFNNLSGTALKLVVNAASIMKNVLAVTVITGFFILQNNAVDQCQRGAANGINLTAMSLFKSVAPACGGAIFSWSEKRQNASFLPGDTMVFFLLNLVQLVALILSCKPFLTTREK